ncbi:MAG: hypothetical protein JWR16_3384 [Nevskia sp.]|nr:hypothetical protein [Nevskia sp.]
MNLHSSPSETEPVASPQSGPVDGSAGDVTQPAVTPKVREIGGRRDGTEPTRFGDWEKGGRCIDF